VTLPHEVANPLDTELGRLAYFGISNSDLDAAISRLPIEEQYVIRETFFEGHSTRHIAREVNKSQFWPRDVKSRAIHNLRKLLLKGA
jgi:DNA-directed RNA polymerase specialized sigma24 family protein